MSRRNDLSISSLLSGNNSISNETVDQERLHSTLDNLDRNNSMHSSPGMSGMAVMNSNSDKSPIKINNLITHNESFISKNEPVVITADEEMSEERPRYPGLAPVRKSKNTGIMPKFAISLSSVPSSNIAQTSPHVASPEQPIEQFQSKFSVNPPIIAAIQPKPPSSSISLQSIMNHEDTSSPNITNAATTTATTTTTPNGTTSSSTTKKKTAKPKKSATATTTKRKTDNTDSSNTQKKKPKKEPKDPNVVKPKVTKAKKKPVEKETAPQPSPPPPKPLVNLPPPTLLDIVEGTARSNSKVDQGPPIIALNIPLCDKDAPPGSAQVVFNVMKMAEDKYGWKTMHPNAKYAMDLMDDFDDDDDMEEDVEEDVDTNRKEKEKDKEIKENDVVEDLAEIERKKMAQMNRKIGKYDYEDPFIDDEELMWEEEAAATKDGFFVYWGPLIEEGQHARIERADGTVKKGRGSKTAVGKKPPSKTKAVTTKKNGPNNTNTSKSPSVPIAPAIKIAPSGVQTTSVTNSPVPEVDSNQTSTPVSMDVSNSKETLTVDPETATS